MAKSLVDKFNLKETEEFAQSHKDAKWYDDFILLYQMIMDEEFKVSKDFYVAVAGVLAYVVFPMDIIPDFLLPFGFFDDAFVISFVMKRFKSEIEAYREFNKKRGRK